MDLTAITTPFGLLDEATREALKAHGGPYETWSPAMGGSWLSCEAQWFVDYVYRVKPKPPKPREWWLLVRSNGSIIASDEKIINCGCHDSIVHVCEVLPD